MINKKENGSIVKIAYVILHYNAYEMTVRCVDSIISSVGKETVDCVIVDNHSPNGSGLKLKQRFQNKANIHVILNGENSGFAKGNNIGYDYAKYKLSADVIVDINNDVTIDQTDFETVINKIVTTNDSIAVIAPKVFNRVGKNQNPFRIKPERTLKLFKSILTYGMYYVGLNSSFLWKLTYKFINRKALVIGESIEYDLYDIVPHGSCVIFTQSYVKKSDYAFLPITHFYGEEDILFDYVKNLGLRTYYCPALCINHWEKVATSTVSENVRERALYQIKNKLQSYFPIIKYRFGLIKVDGVKEH